MAATVSVSSLTRTEASKAGRKWSSGRSETRVQ